MEDSIAATDTALSATEAALTETTAAVKKLSEAQAGFSKALQQQNDRLTDLQRQVSKRSLIIQGPGN